jgi:hypothetical protein
MELYLYHQHSLLYRPQNLKKLVHWPIGLKKTKVVISPLNHLS